MSRFKIVVSAIAVALCLGELFGITRLGLIEPRWGGPRWGDRTLHQWQAQLKHGGLEQRRQAARALASMHSFVRPGWYCFGPTPPHDWVGVLDAPDALPKLVEALHDADPEVRRTVAHALAGCGPYAAAAVPELRVLISDRDTSEAAFLALAAIGPGALDVLPQVKERLHDQEPRVRFAAARAAWAIGREQGAIDICCELIKLKLNPIRNDVLRFMSERSASHPPSIVPQICQLIRAEVLKEKRTREEEALAYDCVNLLAAIGPDAGASVPLVMAIFDQDEQIRENCLRTLSHIGPAARDAAPWIVDWLRNSRMPANDPTGSRYFSQRAAAMRALGDIGVELAVPALIDGLSVNEYGNVRFAAIEALGKLGPASKSAVPRLLPLLVKDGYFSSNVALALWRICEYPDAVPALIADGKLLQNQITLYGLGEIGERAKAAVPFLQSLVADRHELNNIWAAEALWKVTHDRGAIIWLEKLVAANGRNSAEAAGALWRIDRRPEAKAFLVEARYRAALHDEAERVWRSLGTDIELTR